MMIVSDSVGIHLITNRNEKVSKEEAKKMKRTRTRVNEKR